MAWITQNRLQPYTPTRAEPYLTEQIKTLIAEKYFPRYPTKRAALMPLFHQIMHEYGFIAPQAIDEAATFLGLQPSEVQDAVSFYEEFRFEKTGTHVIQVCRSLACELGGHEKLLAKIKEVFGIEPGETSDDNSFTVLEVECLGACESAPCAMIDETLHGPLTPESFVQTIKSLPADKSCHRHVHAAAPSARAQNEEDKRAD